MSDLQMRRGDTLTVTVRDAVDVNDDPIDFGTSVLRFTAKHELDDGDDAAVIRKSSLIAGDVTVVAPGSANVNIAPADTAGLAAATHLLQWDVQVTLADGAVYTLKAGQLSIDPDVTEASSLV